MTPDSYSDAGVSVERGDRFAAFIAKMPSAAVSRGIGGFAGGIPFPAGRYSNPVLLGATDGVGTKLLVAKRLGDYSTVGIDLVAMCVNDLAVCGADPLFFLDYIACGRLDEGVLHPLIEGVVRGCEIAGCTLAGGETAEMPDMYEPGEIDLAGFAAGAVEASQKLPRLSSIRPGDTILGLPSTGIHSNGFTLARKVLAGADESLWRELLTPTRIYVTELARIRQSIKAAAHITGGGLAGNLARVMPDGCSARLDWNWQMPDIFQAIANAGAIPSEEMQAVFNMGIGIAFVVAPQDEKQVADLLEEPVFRLGEVQGG